MYTNSIPENSVKIITGRQIPQRLRRGASAARRIELTADLMTGCVTLRDLTLKQACSITGARPSQVNELRRALAGGSLAQSRHTQAVDRLIDRIIAGRDGARLISRLDEITAPAE